VIAAKSMLNSARSCAALTRVECPLTSATNLAGIPIRCAESTVKQVISRRFVKKQQMRWQPETAHLLLQVRTRTLNGNLRETFQRSWPAMTPVSAPALS
jgi:hypothetical protein